jgi:hypothetical protein
MKYSATTKGFYDESLSYAALPGDLIDITPEYHAELIAGQASGKEIKPDANGIPELADPPQITPQEALAAWRAQAKVSRFQAFAALQQAGKLEAATAAATAAGGLAKLAWDNAIEFRRDSPTIASLAAAVGLDDAALDALFIAAAEIEA